MQGAVRLQSRGAWTTTLANAWGTLAVEKFARAFESVPVKGTTTASLAAASQKLDWAHDPNGGDLNLPWPPAQTDLRVDHNGSGNPWVQIRARAAIPLKSPFRAATESRGRSARWTRIIAADGGAAISCACI